MILRILLIIGNITQPNASPLIIQNSKIYLLDIRNYTWVDRFEPENIIKPPFNNQLNTMKIVIAVISGIVGTAVIMITGFFGYKLYQNRQNNRQNEIMRIPGNN